MGSHEMRMCTCMCDVLIRCYRPAITAHGRIIGYWLASALCNNIEYNTLRMCATYSILVWSSQPSGLDAVRAISWYSRRWQVGCRW